MSKRVISGIQPSGILHLGNYLGALKTYTTHYNNKNSLFFIADNHSITTRFMNQSNIDKLEEMTINTAACLIACGIEENLFVQSQVPQHAELMWIISCMTPQSWLNKMVQYKEKSKNNNNTTIGLYTYPLLMAADIILYKAEEIPVGDDQIQHVEVTRDIAIRLNKISQTDSIPIPNYVLSKISRVMSLQNGKTKMSKSDKDTLSCISLTDDEETVKHKILKARTDPITPISFDSSTRPEVSNLLNIYCSIEQISIEEAVKKFQNSKMLEFKMELINSIQKEITPIGKKVNDLLQDKEYILKKLKDGADIAKNIAEKNLEEIKIKLNYLI